MVQYYCTRVINKKTNFTWTQQWWMKFYIWRPNPPWELHSKWLEAIINIHLSVCLLECPFILTEYMKQTLQHHQINQHNLLKYRNCQKETSNNCQNSHYALYLYGACSTCRKQPLSYIRLQKTYFQIP